MLAVAVDIRRWLRGDRHTPFAERLDRDREIGRLLPADTDTERVVGWWSRVDRGKCAEQPQGERLGSMRRIATAILFAMGLGLGGSVAGVALGYQGDYPVNLLALLGVVVGIPLILLIVTVMLLPGRVPGLAAVRDAVSGFNPGRWAGALLDRLAGVELFAALRSGSSFARWQLVVFSQWLAVGFFVGVLGICWLLIAFTDLAFGWGTTLQIDATAVFQWFSVLSEPWSGWLPVAAPSLELVEASRFYRLQAGGINAARAAQLGEWWPFVLMTIFAYGLLPRLLLLAVGGWRLQAATRSLLRDDPEVTALLDRLNTPRVGFEGELESEPKATDESVPAPDSVAVDVNTVVVIWNEAISVAAAGQWLQSHLGAAAGELVGLSVLQSEAEQRRLLAELPEDVQRFVVITKGWEPPLLEFSDFLNVVRDMLGSSVSLMVVPVDVNGMSVLRDHRAVWSRALAHQHDPRLYVAAADEMSASST
ncbi:MAG: DUF2868 domain-containing protein [Gammaproteobacteria bacterium]|nr:DUF2868 domain-containing protein [Gammaproteobacteria bacterium]